MLPSRVAATPKGSEKLAANAAPSLTADRPLPARTATRDTHPASSACSRAGSMNQRQTTIAATQRIAKAAIVSHSQRRDLPRPEIISGSLDGLRGLLAPGLSRKCNHGGTKTRSARTSPGFGTRGSKHEAPDTRLRGSAFGLTVPGYISSEFASRELVNRESRVDVVEAAPALRAVEPDHGHRNHKWLPAACRL